MSLLKDFNLLPKIPITLIEQYDLTHIAAIPEEYTL